MKHHSILIKGLITLSGTWIGSKIHLLFPTLGLLTLLMIIDYISGMLAAKKEALEHPNNKAYRWNSKKSILGIYKKIGYILTIFVAVSTDYIIFKYSEILGIPVTYNLTSVYLVYNFLFKSGFKIPVI